MKYTLKVLLAAVLLTCVVSACKKYEEGPALSLRTKKARIAGTWKIDKLFFNGADETATYSDIGVIIDKDGLYQTTGADTDAGRWFFVNNKDGVHFRSSDPAISDDEEYEILKLKNKELWLKLTRSNGDVIELRYKQ